MEHQLAERLGHGESNLAALLMRIAQLEIATAAMDRDLQRVLVDHTMLQGHVLSAMAPVSFGAPSPAAAATGAAAVGVAAPAMEGEGISQCQSIVRDTSPDTSVAGDFEQVQHTPKDHEEPQ